MTKQTIGEREYGDFVRKVNDVDGAGRVNRFPDLKKARVDKSYPHFQRAVSNHEMWHQKEVEAAFTKNAAFPSKMSCIGFAEEIVYVSDKWEPHADFFSYVHHFDTHPEVFIDKKHVDGSDAVATSRVVGVPCGPRDRLATPILGRVAEFTIRLHDDTLHVFQFGFPPLMVCSPDREGLIVLTDQYGPMVVRGGQMEITERGIVK